VPAAINTNNIGRLYDDWPTGGYDRGSRSGQQALSAVSPVDRVTLSQHALREQHDQRQAAAGIAGEQALTEEQKEQVKDLKKRDIEVKSHEQAHMASGGGLVQGGASYEYQNGPDGRMYAVGGEVKIDTSQERTPEATIRKMQQVRRAALAPAEPSGTDRAVAAQASQVEARARMERSQKAQEDSQPGGSTDASPLGAAQGARGAGPESAGSSGQTRGSRIDLII
jgi:hypothetical protein